MYPLATFDPGVNGGCTLAQSPTDIIGIKMPDTEAGIWCLFCDLKFHGVKRIVIEQVTGYVQIEGRPQPASRAYTFGKNVGSLHIASHAIGVVPDLVTPQQWQIGLSIFRKKEETYDQWKSRLHRHAMQLFPNVKIIKSVADAFLLLAFVTRQRY